MAPEHGSNNNQFFVRVGVVVAAVVLVMFLAKMWFVDQRGGGTPRGRHGIAAIISWKDAGKFIGEYATVEGTIVASYNSGKACFLNFHPEHKQHFTVVIFKSAFALFPANPEQFYKGKKVRVSGHIKEYQGKPEIIVNDPSQLEILK